MVEATGVISLVGLVGLYDNSVLHVFYPQHVNEVRLYAYKVDIFVLT